MIVVCTALPFCGSLSCIRACSAEQVLKIGDFRIGMLHGHQVVALPSSLASSENQNELWARNIVPAALVVCCPCKPSMLQIVPSGSKERLAFLARQMDVDILVTGHTHEFKVQRKVSTVITPCATVG